MFSWPDLSDSALIWGLAARGIALIYIIALTSIRIEIMALCGSRGISPLAATLALTDAVDSGNGQFRILQHAEPHVLAAPRSLVESPIDGFDERGLQLVTLLRLEMMLEHARTQRLADTMRLGPPPASKAVPGFIHLAPLLARSLPDPEQRLPDIARGSDGEWRIDGMLFTARTLDAHPLAHAADRAS